MCNAFAMCQTVYFMVQVSIMASTAINPIYHEMKSLNAIQASVSALYDEQRDNFHSKSIHDYEGTHELKLPKKF